jgi:hypothetical protein
MAEMMMMLEYDAWCRQNTATDEEWVDFFAEDEVEE